MKKLYTLFILLSGSILFGQEYRPLLDNNNLWTTSESISDGGGGYYRYQNEIRLNDQTINHNEKEYINLEIRTRIGHEFGPDYGEWGEWYDSSIYLHENLEEKNIYIYYRDYEVEFLLYNFDIEVGDTIPTQGFSPNFGFQHPTIVTSINYENHYGLENVKTFQTNHQDDDLIIYEGIGGSHGLFTLITLEHYYSLEDFNPILNIIEMANNKSQIFPNPFSDKIQIQNSKEIKELQLFDLQGKLISTNKNLDELNSKLSSLNNAVYFLKINYKNNKSETIKLIKNK
ncbi:T9SS type A sorting domain-containing protein [Moheibacter sediminis]|uniref:Por secretion system C-terminal sorting domain-containing protein n=1 Tax=Moheibacter sediminis TaxID=1434700 RepID=A0A1W1ZAZ8_9FLAO|nr:T9SS type A sorting domain-containing protein [Moheibacter sediminis]SMC45565.1 Por secretion system C-terminal sorting domain-containing protein [Moheibacter sediminis]